jgi:hypothetical protein
MQAKASGHQKSDNLTILICGREKKEAKYHRFEDLSLI